jgi:hypothetical protein
MPNYYGKSTCSELHQASLKESAKKAERMEKFFANHPNLDPENETHMDRAQKNYNFAYPESEEMIAKGYVDEQESKTYAYTSHEAATRIADGAKEIQKQKKCSYLEAVNEYYADPQNKAVIVAYAQAD